MFMSKTNLVATISPGNLLLLKASANAPSWGKNNYLSSDKYLLILLEWFNLQ